MTDKERSKCECGAIYGQSCDADENEELVTILWVQPHLRASAKAAGGDAMRFGIRIQVRGSCARNILRDEAEWACAVE